MRPILFNWRGIRIPSYTALVYLGAVVGIAVGNTVARQAGLDTVRIYVVMILLIVPAAIGARFLFIALNWQIYQHHWPRVWRREEGGAASYGGIVLALLVSLPVLYAFQVSFLSFWDVACISLLVGLAIGRVGCLLNGCCAGRPNNGPLCIYLPNHLGVWQKRYPTQLLEVAWVVVLLIFAALFWTIAPFDGAIFLFAMGSYGLGRLVLDRTRAQETQMLVVRRFHTTAQALSAAVPLLILLARFVSE